MKRENNLNWKYFFNDIYSLLKKGIIYVSCILLITTIAKKLIEYPLLIAYKYNIVLTGEEYVNLYNTYKYIFIFTLLIPICAIPVVRLVNRLKNASKNGLEFYDDEKQNQNINSQINKEEVSQDVIQNLINSNDDKIFDEKKEEDMYDSILQDQDKKMNLLKCQNIKNHMKPLTQLVTMELYNHSKENITLEITTEFVKSIGKRKKKKFEDKNKEIAKNILEFLNNNDIIESDDMTDNKYYFTLFGNTYMNYFSSGII